MPNKDQPDGQVINIIQDKPYENTGKNDTILNLTHSIALIIFVGPSVTAADALPNQYSVETLIMAVVAGAVSALVVGFIAGYLCGRKCHKDEDDNLPYPDTEYEYFEQRQNMNRYNLVCDIFITNFVKTLFLFYQSNYCRTETLTPRRSNLR